MIVILNRTQIPENLGFACRNMKNFGLSELRLVSPGLLCEEEWGAMEHNKNFNLDSFMQKAISVAKGGGDIIKNAKVYNTIEEASVGIERIYALSARRRDISKEVITPETCATEYFNNSLKTALLFGAEASGLSNKDLCLCYKIVEIEANKEYSSINLGMSVGIMAHLIYSMQNKEKFINSQRGIRNIAKLESVESMTNLLLKKLEDANYFKVKEKQEGMEVNIRNIFSKTPLTEAECKTLAGVFSLINDNSRR